MRRATFISAFALGAAGIAGVTSSSSQAVTSSVDLAMTGTVVAGVSGAQLFQEVPFSFTMTNKSSSTSAAVAFVFTVTNGSADSADSSDYVCPLISNRFNIYPDTPDCEPGTLQAGKSTRAAILVTPKATGTMTVRACATNLQNYADPVSSNNCRTLKLSIS